MPLIYRWSWRILQRRLLFSKAPSGKYSDNRIFGFQGTSEKQFLLACIARHIKAFIGGKAGGKYLDPRQAVYSEMGHPLVLVRKANQVGS